MGERGLGGAGSTDERSGICASCTLCDPRVVWLCVARRAKPRRVKDALEGINKMAKDDKAASVRKVRERARLARLLVLGLVCVVAAWLAKYFWFTLPIGEGGAGRVVPRELFQSVWSTRPVLLVGIGDSVTAGYGTSESHSYFERLASNPRDEFPELNGICLTRVLPNLKCRMLAVSGSTSLQHHASQLAKLEIQPREVFGLVVMTTGGNDLIHNYGRTPPAEGAMYGSTMEQARPWIEAFDARMTAMLDRIDECFPGGCAVFVANIYDPTDGVGNVDGAGLPPWPDGLKILEAYNGIIARHCSARANVHLVNMHDEFLGHGIHCTQPWRQHYHLGDPHYWYYSNLEDPNDRGYDAIRRLFLLEIARAWRAGPAGAGGG
jgi:lysophospholipase L1-like esterase